VHYTMGGLWVDYELQSTVPGLFVLGEANFSDHGANRLGASALMQGLADGYFVIPYTLGNYIAGADLPGVSVDDDAFSEAENAASERIRRLLSVRGNKTVVEFHRELGSIMWDHVGMSRNADGLRTAVDRISALRDEFWQNVLVPGEPTTYNKYLEFAGRVADFLELGELMARDALNRDESCGGHFREEYQTEEGEALRRDDDYSYVAAWEHDASSNSHNLHREDLEFENVSLTTRSYK
ncbi:MAG: FAD-binding protein, partial [Rhodothermales bacterium]|nr:FAD-binding protein [Rhodothermales bacterium]